MSWKDVVKADKKEYTTLREQLQASIDKLKEAQGKEGENPPLDAAIRNTQLLMDDLPDEELDRPIKSEVVEIEGEE